MNAYDDDPNGLEEDLFNAIRHSFSIAGEDRTQEDFASITAAMWTRGLLDAMHKRQEGGQPCRTPE